MALPDDRTEASAPVVPAGADPAAPTAAASASPAASPAAPVPPVLRATPDAPAPRTGVLCAQRPCSRTARDPGRRASRLALAGALRLQRSRRPGARGGRRAASCHSSPAAARPSASRLRRVAGPQAARTLVARVPVSSQPSAPARPLLRAERRARSAPPLRAAPRARPALRARASRAPSAAAHDAQPDGRVSVTLDPRAPVASAPPAAPTLARAPEGGDAESLPRARSRSRRRAGAPARGGRTAGPPAPTLEDTYDYVVERLRRDLLIERERMGDLIGRLP